MTVFSLSYSFNQGTQSAPKNNGSVVTIQNNRDNTRTQAFTYDSLNRIASAQTLNSTLWGDTYVIDAWGNLTNKNQISGKGGENLQTSALTNNQLTGMTYDVAGNVINDGLGHAYVYDAEDRLISAGGMSYIYDGDGNRVEKCTAGSTAGTGASGATGTLYWRGKDSDTINESDLAASIWKRFVYFNGKMVARRDSDTQKIYFFYSDHLGSMGVVTDQLGQTILNESDYYPYGGERAIASSLSDEHYKFTGKERDSESGLDNFGARYDASTLGRFMSPDPPLLDQHIADPQSWNLYSYARNNPLSYIDPTGNSVELLGDDEQRKKALAFLQKSLGNDKAASNLYINEVKDGDKTRYFVGIKGDVGDFMKQSDTSHDLANLVQNKNVVEFGLTSNDLSNQGGAVTYEKGEVGNQNVRVLVNPAQAEVANRVLDPNTILGASRWGGQNQDPRSRVNPFTGEVMAWHEFGHAWGNINGRPLDRTNPEALAWENRMREQLYGPIGPNNAPRVAH